MLRQTMRDLIEGILREAPADDDDPIRGRTKVRDRVDTGFPDLDPTALDRPAAARRPLRARATGPDPTLPRPNQVRPVDLGGGPVTDGDFDQEIDAGLEQAGRDAVHDEEDPGDWEQVDGQMDVRAVPHATPRQRRPAPAGGPPRPDVPRFQPNQPVYNGDPGVVPEPERDVSEEVLGILMREFVRPAMGVGQHILPSVYHELARLKASDPTSFSDQLGFALQEIRSVEDRWFEQLLGTYPRDVRMEPGSEAQRAMRDRIVHVLQRYYEAVLEAAGANSRHLRAAMDDLIEEVGSETFNRSFAKALSATRDVEDAAFLQVMGGPRRLG